MTHTMFGLFNLGGGEVILMLALLLILLVVPAAIIGFVFLIIRMTRKTGNSASPSAAPPIRSGGP